MLGGGDQSTSSNMHMKFACWSCLTFGLVDGSKTNKFDEFAQF